MSRARFAHTTILGVVLLLLPPGPAIAQSSDIEMSPISGAVKAPRRHFRLRNPAALTPKEAASVYDIALHSMRVGYARSGDHIAVHYTEFPRYNIVPYLSATHGNHYVNNYANDTASAYGQFEQAGTLPVGSLLAKDSFSMTESGEILLGPLFIMEKMNEGFSYSSGDWRYTLIQPDGTFFGTTNGEGTERVAYCIGCHAAVAHQDHLYFIPKGNRVSN